jgi:hypothetical protein
MSGMTSCSMTCCQDSDHAAVTSAIFILPDAMSAPAQAIHTASVTLARPSDLLRSIEPLSPPPRFPAAAF